MTHYVILSNSAARRERLPFVLSLSKDFVLGTHARMKSSPSFLLPSARQTPPCLLFTTHHSLGAWGRSGSP